MLKSKILTKYSTEIATAPLFEILYKFLRAIIGELFPLMYDEVNGVNPSE
jgi:hypothetical protein